MIKEISLHGFKSYVNQNFDLRPLTILTGLNSSGKSSVIQAIRLLDNIATYKDKNKAFYQLNIGNLKPYLTTVKLLQYQRLALQGSYLQLRMNSTLMVNHLVPQ